MAADSALNSSQRRWLSSARAWRAAWNVSHQGLFTLEGSSDSGILALKELSQRDGGLWRHRGSIRNLVGEIREGFGDGLEIFWQVIVLEELQDAFDGGMAGL
jgi:hypothetical protein